MVTAMKASEAKTSLDVTVQLHCDPNHTAQVPNHTVQLPNHTVQLPNHTKMT